MKTRPSRTGECSTGRCTSAAPTPPCAFRGRGLDEPTRFGNAETNRLLAASCDKMLAELLGRGGIRAGVRRLLLHDPIGLGSPEAVAEVLGMSERSLRRKLLDAGRPSPICCTRRAWRSHSITCVTRSGRSAMWHRLGYSDESAFARAFKRSFGQTPRSARSLGLTPPFDADPVV